MDSSVMSLQGLRVLVTRPLHQAEALSSRLRALGAVPFELPVIEIAPLPDAELDEALGDIQAYDWIVFTSVNTVSTIGGRVAGATVRPRIAAIGDATASALTALGVVVDLAPENFVGESVLAALVERGVDGNRILLPRAEVARDTLPDGLRAAGAEVDVVPVYRSRRAQFVDTDVLDRVRAGDIDVITFTSPSTVRNLLDILDMPYPANVCTACIGPVTAREAEDAGLRVDTVANEYSVPGLVQALVEGMHR